MKKLLFAFIPGLLLAAMLLVSASCLPDRWEAVSLLALFVAFAAMLPIVLHVVASPGDTPNG